MDKIEIKNKLIKTIKDSEKYKYYFASFLLLMVGVNLLNTSKSASIPECNYPAILEKLKYKISAAVYQEKFSINKVNSIFEVNEIESEDKSQRNCHAGLTIDGSPVGGVNYTISIAAPGSKEKVNISSSLDN